VQECPVAEALARRGWPAIARHLDRVSWDPRWHEVMVHLAALLDDPTPLLELLADQSKDNILRHRVRLTVLPRRA
jgi:hypothetical protein